MKYVNKNVIKNRKNKNVYTKKSLFFYFFRKHSYDFFFVEQANFLEKGLYSNKKMCYTIHNDVLGEAVYAKERI